MKAVPQRKGLQAAVARGSTSRVLWVETGEVVPASTVAERWRVATRSVGDAARRGVLSSIVISRRRYYPREFVELDLDVVKAVSAALRPVSPEVALMFWKRSHGALGGKAPTTLLRDVTVANRQQRVVQLAQAWAAQSVAAAGLTVGARRTQTRGR